MIIIFSFFLNKIIKIDYYKPPLSLLLFLPLFSYKGKLKIDNKIFTNLKIHLIIISLHFVIL